MLLQAQYTFDNSAGATYAAGDWFPVNCAGYDTLALTVYAATGWIGSISFWGGAGVVQESPALWSLNDAEDSSLVSQVETVTGATPTAFAKNYRGNIAGLAEFGIYFADPSTYVSAVGTIRVRVGMYASAK